MAYSDALDREAAWLATTGDSLPDLTASFQVIQARWPRVPAESKTGLYVLRAPLNGARVHRFAAQRQMLTTAFRLVVNWPVRAGSGRAESDQLALDQAVDALLARVLDVLGDHTHGGRFLSVAEDPAMVDVVAEDVEVGLARSAYRVYLTYSADDTDTAG